GSCKARRNIPDPLVKSPGYYGNNDVEMKSGKCEKGLEEGESSACSWKCYSRLSFLREKIYHG
ncbi:unnamed protein product, partial [Allacma fusca]